MTFNFKVGIDAERNAAYRLGWQHAELRLTLVDTVEVVRDLATIHPLHPVLTDDETMAAYQQGAQDEIEARS